MERFKIIIIKEIIKEHTSFLFRIHQQIHQM